jgi:hypothetical protein
MSKYILILKQEGDSCDCMLGCGYLPIELKAITAEDAKHESIEIIKDQAWVEDCIFEGAVVCKSLYKFPILELKQMCKEEVEMHQREEIEEKELAELKRLSEKYKYDKRY